MDKKSFLSKQKAKQKGFTLMELVVVIIILGILAAIAVPKYVDLTSTAKGSAGKACGNAVKTAFQFYLGSTKGNYPQVNSIIANLQVDTVPTVVNGGLRFEIDSSTFYTTKLYTNTDCSTGPVTAGSDVVQCVGATTSST